MSRSSGQIAIIGAGIAGLSIGWRLAKQGLKVDVFDTHAPGSGATWAAAGMLAARNPAHPPALRHAARLSGDLWPHFHRELEDISGLKVPFRQDGALTLALSGDEADAMLEAALSEGGADASLEILSPPLPAPMTAEARLALFDKSQSWVDNRALGPALAKAVLQAGARLRSATAVARVLVEGTRIAGIETAGGMQAVDGVVIAAGAWSGTIDGLPLNARAPVSPRKGQMIALDPGRAGAPFREALHGGGVYLVPRPDGRVAVGATVEDSGFDASVQAEAVTWLAAGAARLVPQARDWPVVEAWAGLRPGTPDDLPILGGTEIEGLFYATGQFRNGILFAPWMADMIAALVTSGRAPSGIGAFGLARFSVHGLAT